MPFDHTCHQRRSVRLNEYDYAAPALYFVTLCTQQRRLSFDEPAIRQIAEACWRAIQQHAPGVALDEWVVMPHHVHGVIVITGDVGDGLSQDNPGRHGTDVEGRGVQLNAPTANGPQAIGVHATGEGRDAANPFSVMSPRRNTLAVIVRTYKAAVTSACRAANRADFAWQHGFYEHVVRNQRALDASRRYVRDNPRRWALDRDNPQKAHHLPPPIDADEYLADVAASEPEGA